MIRRISGGAPGAAPGGADAGSAAAQAIHMPSPSYHPLVAALGVILLGYGLVEHWALLVPGGVVTAFGLLAWAMEPEHE